MRKELLLYLNAIQISYREMGKIMDQVSSIDELNVSFRNIPFLSKKSVEKIQSAISHFQFERYRETLWKNEIQTVCIFDENYPVNLRDIKDAPYILYYKGNLSEIFQYSIAIVGARKCTHYGAWACEYFAKELSQMGIPIVSGLALGIDKMSHIGALQYDNWTCGVIGCGPDRIYPAANRYLYEQMEKHPKGLILTEYPLGMPPMAHCFPWRNRIIAGISLATIVIEAKEKSGTLITAGYAAENGRDVFAVPGNINSVYSTGTNRLVQDGAKLIQSVEDVLEELPILKNLAKDEKEDVQLTMEQTLLLEHLREPKTVDTLAFEMKESVQNILFILTELELMGVISEQGDQFMMNTKGEYN